MKVTPMLPIAAVRQRQKPDSTFIISASFIVGFLIGIPITYSLLYLPIFFDSAFYSSIPERTLSPLMNDVRGYGQNDTPDLSASRPTFAGRGHEFAGIKSKIVASGYSPSEAASFLLGHPAESKPSKSQRTITEKSGPPSGKSTAKNLPVVSSLIVKPINKQRRPSSMDIFRGKILESPEKFFKIRDIVNGVYWTPLSERFVPRGFDNYDIELWRRFLNSTDVVKVEEGCGRMQNRLVTMAEGGKSCCRYRHNNDQIQGEIFSFYLGRLLGIRNLSPSALALVDSRTKRWSSAAAQIALAQWSSERPVVLTQFVENLQPAYIPKQFRITGERQLHPIKEDLQNMTSKDISELVQWTDLVIFDFLTGNLDRVVNNMFNERWNSEMMNQPTHNLAKTPEGLLLFMDNESGLLHGYRLLEKYDHFHKALLDSLCIFKKDTIDALHRLQDGNLGQMLRNAFTESDPGMSDWLPFLPERSLKTLKERIAYILKHYRTCESRFVPENLVINR